MDSRVECMEAAEGKRRIVVRLSSKRNFRRKRTNIHQLHTIFNGHPSIEIYTEHLSSDLSITQIVDYVNRFEASSFFLDSEWKSSRCKQQIQKILDETNNMTHISMPAHKLGDFSCCVGVLWIRSFIGLRDIISQFGVLRGYQNVHTLFVDVCLIRPDETYSKYNPSQDSSDQNNSQDNFLKHLYISKLSLTKSQDVTDTPVSIEINMLLPRLQTFQVDTDSDNLIATRFV